MKAATMRTHWFVAVAVAGFLLGILLLVESVLTYRYVAGHLVIDHLHRLAGQYVSSLESRTRQIDPDSMEQLRALLEEFREARPGEVAWIRVVNQQGTVLAESGDSGGHPLAAQALRDLLELRVQSLGERRATPRGEALVLTLPFRVRFRDQRSGPPEPLAGAARPRFNVTQVALYLRGGADPFWALRRNLAVSTAAALALLASMAVFFLRFRSYLRGRQMEQQLALARRVQQELLPRSCPSCEQLDFAASCLPAWEVGGDYYDVFSTGNGRITLVLGDVAGKGLPAALLMGLLHGAVRAASAASDGSNHAELASQLNELLCARTSQDRFVSLFWASYDVRERVLRHVNAGHLPPMLIREGAGGRPSTERLESGGPVLGLLPRSPYEQGEVALRAGDLLVLYSDGVVEAANWSEEDFGEERLQALAEANWDRPAEEIQRLILEDVKRFVGHKPLADDLTLLVARVCSPAVGQG